MLEIRGLNVEFKTESTWFHAVNNVSFTLETGRVIGIVGESGSGKSVTSLAVMRLHDEQSTRISGSVLLNDVEILNLPEDQMQSIRGNRISMIFQEPMTSLNPVFTCGFQVAEAIQQHQSVNHRVAREKTIELFKEVQLPRPEYIFDSYPHQLSGGQKQRVMIAMALSCNPEMLIADEPTTALDVTVQKTILDLLLRLKDERNMSLIFISHDLGVIGEIADEVVVMYQGKIVEKASIQDIFSNPEHPYTRGLLACRPSPVRKLRKLPVVSDFLEKSPEGKTITKNSNVSAFLDQLALNEQEIVSRKRELYSQSPILRVVGLQTWYPIKKSLFYKSKEFVKAVDDVSLEVFPGETLGLVGESGCGKTTLGRSILRLVEPTGGKIFFKDTDLNTLSAGNMRRYRKNMQIIFQDPYSALNPRLTVGQSIMEPMQVHQVYANNKLRKDHVMQLLERVNLNPDHFNRYPHEFSGGQRQRISIARALALQPELIICDESVSALDVSVQAQVLNLLKELQTEFNLTYIFISHDLAVVKHISDRMIVMNQGKIEEEGDPDDIYNNPKNPYTKKLIDAIPKHN